LIFSKKYDILYLQKRKEVKNMAYFFKIGLLRFIFNVQYSTIGYSYPRLFVAWPDGSYNNFDLTLGTIFKQTEEEWSSWFDDELVTLDSIEDVRRICHDAGINWDTLEKICFDLYEKHK
jgi:hypothetical protein